MALILNPDSVYLRKVYCPGCRNYKALSEVEHKGRWFYCVKCQSRVRVRPYSNRKHRKDLDVEVDSQPIEEEVLVIAK